MPLTIEDIDVCPTRRVVNAAIRRNVLSEFSAKYEGRIESDANSQPNATKDSNIVETKNNNKEEILDSFLNFIISTCSGDIIPPNTITKY